MNLMPSSGMSHVPLPKGQNIVACKWLFRVKRNPNGLVASYKACLVAKGFTQCPRIDFKEAFVCASCLPTDNQGHPHNNLWQQLVDAST